jgi:hypothetical protein
MTASITLVGACADGITGFISLMRARACRVRAAVMLTDACTWLVDACLTLTDAPLKQRTARIRFALAPVSFIPARSSHARTRLSARIALLSQAHATPPFDGHAAVARACIPQACQRAPSAEGRLQAAQRNDSLDELLALLVKGHAQIENDAVPQFDVHMRLRDGRARLRCLPTESRG